jgi:predicted amidophosphoribosyltransferase
MKAFCAKCLTQREYICTDCLGCEVGTCCSCPAITPEWTHVQSLRGRQAMRQLVIRMEKRGEKVGGS